MAERLVALRGDASRAIGMGHLIRLHDLGRALDAQGIAHIYACTPETAPILRTRGIAANRIITADPAANWVSKHKITHVVADIMWSGNVFAAAREVAALTATRRPVTVIDSMPPDHFVTAPGTIAPACVVTPYLGAEHLRPAPRTGDWAAGADFAVMDDSYLTARTRVQPPLPRRVLVSCGGADPTGLSLRIAQALAPTDLPVDLVIGPLYPADTRNALARMADDHRNLTLHGPQQGLSALIESCGLVVGRIGLLRYQAAVLGRTGIYLFEGSEYRAYLENFAAAGLAEVFFADPPEGSTPFLARLAALADPAVQARLFTLNTAAMDAVHGNGAANVIDRILQQEWTGA